MRWKKPNVHRPFKGKYDWVMCLRFLLTNATLVWWPIVVFFLAASVFCKPALNHIPPLTDPFPVLVAPFLRPANKVGDTPPLPYYLYCFVGIGVMAAGVLYWAGWRIILPKVFGYELVPRKEKLADGTTITLVRVLRDLCERVLTWASGVVLETEDSKVGFVILRFQARACTRV